MKKYLLKDLEILMLEILWERYYDRETKTFSEVRCRIEQDPDPKTTVSLGEKLIPDGLFYILEKIDENNVNLEIYRDFFDKIEISSLYRNGDSKVYFLGGHTSFGTRKYQVCKGKNGDHPIALSCVDETYFYVPKKDPLVTFPLSRTSLAEFSLIALGSPKKKVEIEISFSL